MSLQAIAHWIAATPPSVLIQTNEGWFIPAVQSIHIAAIGVVMACVLMMTLRVLGYAGMDQSVLQTQQRFGPWMIGALWLLLGTGLLMIIGEPERELVTFSFWAKMLLVATGTVIALLFQRSVRTSGPDWEDRVGAQMPVKIVAGLTLAMWLAVIFLGRLIAYDHVWGALSPSIRQ
jgi:hypothetical protein